MKQFNPNQTHAISNLQVQKLVRISQVFKLFSWECHKLSKTHEEKEVLVSRKAQENSHEIWHFLMRLSRESHENSKARENFCKGRRMNDALFVCYTYYKEERVTSEIRCQTFNMDAYKTLSCESPLKIFCWQGCKHVVWKVTEKQTSKQTMRKWHAWIAKEMWDAELATDSIKKTFFTQWKVVLPHRKASKSTQETWNMQNWPKTES